MQLFIQNVYEKHSLLAPREKSSIKTLKPRCQGKRGCSEMRWSEEGWRGWVGGCSEGEGGGGCRRQIAFVISSSYIL